MTYDPNEERDLDEEDEMREMAETAFKEVLPFKALIAGFQYAAVQDKDGNTIKGGVLTFSTTLSLEDIHKIESIATAMGEIEVMVSPIQPLESEMSLFKPEA